MITLILFFIGLCNLNTAPMNSTPIGDTIKWYTWEEAYALNQQIPKKIFVDLYTDWCGWCKRMDATTFQDPAIVKYMNDHFYAIKFDAEQKESVEFQGKTFEFMETGRRGVHQLAYALLDGQLGYPSFVALDESFSRIFIAAGYLQPEQLVKKLEFAKEEKYSQMSLQAYESGTSGQ